MYLFFVLRRNSCNYLFVFFVGLSGLFGRDFLRRMCNGIHWGASILGLIATRQLSAVSLGKLLHVIDTECKEEVL